VTRFQNATISRTNENQNQYDQHRQFWNL